MGLLQRECRQCRKNFEGGPRAYYCPSCRQERAKAQGREHQRRKRKGLVRPLGSLDKCEMCGGEYVVTGGNQRFCQTCQPIHAAAYDRETSLAYYRANRCSINPRRYQLRKAWYTANKDRINNLRRLRVVRLKTREASRWAHLLRLNCKAIDCENTFLPNRPHQEYCSPRCRYRDNKQSQYAKRSAAGICPQCGKSINRQVSNAKHCDKCTAYYRKRYINKKSPTAE